MANTTHQKAAPDPVMTAVLRRTQQALFGSGQVTAGDLLPASAVAVVLWLVLVCIVHHRAPVVLGLLGAASAASVYSVLYRRQYAYHRAKATTPLRVAAGHGRLLDEQQLGSGGFRLGEAAANTVMTGVDHLWAIASLDPTLLAAAERLNLPGVHGRASLETFLTHHANVVTQPGWQHRVVGYMGEQRAADLLAQHGHLVTMASTVNQPVWDMYVDHHAVNIKTYQSVAEAKAEAASHPTVTYLLPDDAHGHAVGNIVKLNGFHHDALAGHLHSAVSEAVHGGVLSHIPAGTILVTAWRARANYRSGMVVADIASEAGTRLVFNGGGWAAGSFAGAKVGALVLHPHAGAAIGGVAGFALGSKLGRAIRHPRLHASASDVGVALAEYGRFYARPDVVTSLHRRLWTPIGRQRSWLSSLTRMRTTALVSGGPRSMMWPSSELVLLNATIRHGRAVLRASTAAIRSTDQILNRVPQGQMLSEYGLLMANLPAIALDYGSNPEGLGRVEGARSRAEAVRRQAAETARQRQVARERRKEWRGRQGARLVDAVRKDRR